VRSSVFDVLTPEQQHHLREIATVVADHLRPSISEAKTTPC
jgi:hypothetical protein